MKVFILYDKSGIYSGRELGSKIISEFSKKGVDVSKGRLSRLDLLHKQGVRFDYIINVGWYKDFDSKGAKIINSPNSIALSSNKRRARITFKDAEVPAPQLWLNPESIPEDAFPVVARTTHHTKGKGFWLCNNRREALDSTRSFTKKIKKLITTRKGNRVWRDRYAEVTGSTHFMKFIPNTREFRVHIVTNEMDYSKIEDSLLEDSESYKNFFYSIKTSEKMASEPSADTTIKNHENGWVFSYPKDRKDPALALVRDAAKQAILAVGLHWGAVDIMYSEDTGEVYVLEVNSSPCMTDENSNTVDKYVKGIGSMIGVFEKIERKEEVPKTEEPAAINRDLIRSALRRVM